MTSVSRTIYEPRAAASRLTALSWALGGLIAALFVWFHFDFIWRSILFGLNNKNWSHALLVPFISVYFIFVRRHRFSTAPVDALSRQARFVWWVVALAILGTGVAAYLVAAVIPMTLVAFIARVGGIALMAGGGVLLLAAGLFSPVMVRSFWGPVLDRLRLGTRPEFWLRVLGLGVMIAALVTYVLTLYPISNHMARGYSMIGGLFGLVLFLAGPRAMAVLWLPILYLVFAVKISYRLWQQVAQQLQDIAAVGSTVTLKAFAAVMNFEVTGSGNQITMFVGEAMTPYPINIVEACSGLRMLMAFVALGTALAFAWDRKWWQRLIIIASTVPIAVLINIGRVTVIGLLYLVDPELGRGDTHTFVGMLMLIPAALLLIGIGWVLDRIIIEEPTGAAPPTDAPAATETEPAGQAFAAQNDGAQSSRMRAMLGPTMSGFALGGVLMLLAVGGYVLVLGMYRPDIIGHVLTPATARVLLALTMGVLALGTVLVPWYVLRRRGIEDRARVWLTSMGVVTSVLLVGTFGQQTLLGMTKAVLFKKELPLRRPLVFLPDEVGSWHKRGEDTKLPPAIEGELGTKKYLVRNYVDSDWPEGEPGGQAKVQVAYYPGSIDNVPHVPDRCYVAGGMEPKGTTEVNLQLTDDRYRREGDQYLVESQLLRRTMQYDNPVRVPAGAVPATRFAYRGDQTGRGGKAGNVIYFFTANGQFLASPRDVRMEAWNPTDQYAYYCKIEVAWPGISDPALATRRTEALLSKLLPEVMACLPDWRAVQAGEYPLRPDQQKNESEQKNAPNSVANAS